MTERVSASLRYPIGTMQRPRVVTSAHRQEWIAGIAEAPALLRDAVKGLSDEQLDTVYRPDGWTLRQVVHHVADSHINAYIRFRWALTETRPLIKAYVQDAWAGLPDARTAPLESSLVILESLHVRWVFLLRSLSEDDFARLVIHPENGPMSVDDLLATYAWHGRHHVAHITSLRDRMGWAA